MDRVRDSRRGGTCSSSSNSSANRRPTCYSNEEDGQVGLRDRAARKERERERLRELLNRGRKKRRRISSDKLTVSPAPSPAIVICASVPRKPRSVGSRRKGKSWVFDRSNANLKPAPDTGKSSPLVQNEVEMEIAEVLFGLQKQESPPGSTNENQSFTVQNSSVHTPQAEPLSINAASELSKDKSEIHNQDAPVKQEMSTVEEGVASTSAVEAKSKCRGKFVIDLMKPPPVEFWPEEVEAARSSSSTKTACQDVEVGGRLCSIKKEVVYEKQPLPKMLIKAELRDFDEDHSKDEPNLLFQKQQMKTWPNTSIANGLSLAQIGSPFLPLELTGSSTGPPEGEENHLLPPVLKPPDFRLIQSRPKRCTTHRTIAQSIYRHQQTLHDDSDLLGSERISRNRQQGLVPDRDLNCARDRTQAIEVYLRTAQKGNSLRPASTSDNVHKHASRQIPMAGPFVFPFSQNQTMTARQSEIPLSASPSASMRFSHPNGAPFLAVLPEFMGKKMQQASGRKNIQPLPFFDRQLHSTQMFYPIQIQQPKNFPLSTPAVDIRTSRSQRNVTDQSVHAGQDNSMSLSPFAYSRQSNSTNAGGPDLNFSLAPNSVSPRGFLENPNLGSQALRAGHQMQHRNSHVFQNMGRGESMQADNLPFAKQIAVSTRTHLSNSNPLAAKPAPFLLQNQQQQMLHAMAASQLRLPPTNAAKVSKDFAFFSGNFFDRSKSSHSLQRRASDIKQAYEVFP